MSEGVISGPATVRQPNTVKQARLLVGDLFQRRPWIYWSDFLISLVIGYSAASVFLRAPVAWPVALLAYMIAVVALYRVSLFMHEIAHMRAGEMRSFKVAWNLLAGIPMMLPSFFYDNHREHHNTQHYGTHDDGEYLPLAHGSMWGIVGFIAQIFYLPALTFIRHLFITPVSIFHRGVRQWVLEHWSSFVINLRYKRPLKHGEEPKWWMWMEIACHLRVLLIFALIGIGFDPWYFILLLYSIAVGILTLNHLRTLAAHRYRSDGQTMTHEQQLLDSTDIVGGGLVTLALCPVGLRFHALHHLFPGMPYHNLRQAHNRLMAQLPADSPYRACAYPSIASVIRELVGEIRQRRSAEAETALSASQIPAEALADTSQIASSDMRRTA